MSNDNIPTWNNRLQAEGLGAVDLRGEEQELLSVVLKLSHPLWPVIGLGTTGPGPGACRVELAVPFQCP